MKILHVNTYSHGGAAAAAIRLHLGLLNQDINSEMLFKNDNRSIPESHVFQWKSNKPEPGDPFAIRLKLLQKRLEGSIARRRADKAVSGIRNFDRPNGLDVTSIPLSAADLTSCPQYDWAEIIHLHWVADFLDWKSFFARNKKPVVWTLHDQNPYLGIDHYNERFLGMDSNGIPLKRTKSKREQQVSEHWLHFKKESISKASDLTIVSPSRWMWEEASKSEALKKFKHLQIPYGYPTSVFKKLDKESSRQILDLPKDSKILLFVADNITNQRKGFAYLAAALEQIEQKQTIFLCTIGSQNANSFGKNVRSLGKIQNDEILSAAYSAADVFIIPSLEDNLPNTMIESLLCGTPVIGFPIGGIPDAVKDGINGFICDDISVSSLTRKIEQFLESDYFDRQKIADEAKEKYNLERQAKAYIEVYKSILK